MTQTEVNAVIRIAARWFNQLSVSYIRPEDALVYALEECDTGYDLSEVEYGLLLKRLKKELKMG